MEFKVPDKLPGMDITRLMNDPSERVWSGPFTFVLAADPQFGMIGNCKLKSSVPTWKAEMKLTNEAIQKVNGMHPKPKFLLFCGDMLDALPFQRENILFKKIDDLVIRDKQYKDFVKVVNGLDPEIKPIFVCGNHDVGDVPTEDTIKKYRSEFGPDFFSFWVGGVKFIVINSQYFYSPNAVPEETNKQEKFIEEQISDDSAKHIVVFQHIPFFGNHPEEPDQYCNIVQERRLPLLEKFHSLGVRHIFCGHYHKNAGGRYKDMEQVVTAALGAPFGDDPSGFRVVHVGEKEIIHEYVKLRETTDCSEFEIEQEQEEFQNEAARHNEPSSSCRKCRARNLSS